MRHIGNMQRIIGAALDIAERKHPGQELLDQQKAISSLSDNYYSLLIKDDGKGFDSL